MLHDTSLSSLAAGQVLGTGWVSAGCRLLNGVELPYEASLQMECVAVSCDTCLAEVRVMPIGIPNMWCF